MLLARAIKLGGPATWPPCLRLYGLMPESVVARSGLSRGPEDEGELHRVSRHWQPGPGETLEEASRQRAELRLAGQQWADAATTPLEQFLRKLHDMFLAVLRTGTKKEEEVGLLLPTAQKRIQQDCYPWHQLQLPRPQQTTDRSTGARAAAQGLGMGTRFPASHAKLAQGATLAADRW